MRLWREGYSVWITRRRSLATLGALLPAPLLGQRVDPNPDASVEIEEVRVGIGVVGTSIGGGRLRWRGEEYSFRIRGLTMGAIGVSSLQARGEVFALTRLEDFSGTYAEDPSETPTDPGAPSGGPIVRFLRNPHGVRLRLRATRDGAMLEISPGGLNIELR